MSAARDQALIESKNTGRLGHTTIRMPALVQHSPAALSGPEGRSQKPSWTTFLGIGSAILAVGSAIAFYHPWQLLTTSSVAAENHSAQTPKTVTIARPTPATSASVVLP